MAFRKVAGDNDAVLIAAVDLGDKKTFVNNFT